MLQLIILGLGLLITSQTTATATAPADSTDEETIRLDMFSAIGFMNDQKLERILAEKASILESRPGYWQISFYQRPMLVVTDEVNNRMRIMSPVIEQKNIPQHQFAEILEAQFDRALDVKYALSQQILWSVYIHPLKELTEEQLVDALEQVFMAAQNFGDSYRSTGLEFGGREEGNSRNENEYE